MSKLIFSVGYNTKETYKSTENGKKTKCYQTWQNMLMRCYDEKFHARKPAYIGCKVCEEWHNFQNFAKWYEENYYEIEGERMHLDKDILVKGNKIYSPQTCVFVPQRINNLFEKCDRVRGNYPVGVHKDKNKFRAKIRIGHKLIYLGIFDNPHEAYLLYKINKELLIQSVAEEYKDKIPKILYKALINYNVEEND